ncbi:Bug family tripartite tricarboxylate transporter substrate binding protein [Microbacterium enclense]|uniref:Putative tricarboxylic transport membrane protein n=1 Tax=Microbacterium enclense TaxID=993073 RepID=A0A1G6R4K5_9MICO|nr:tripartite tricarboxylate transporter substrate-binding protein [Microbacterium enclense]KSU51738.1 tricarboxylic transporter [Microbacterium enclense]SDC99468.1 putative tricarboxylic transport membrane protein [Microbacterium enclense]
MKRALSLAILAVITAGTVSVAVVDAADGSSTGGPRSNLTIVVPGSAGGGYDSLAREAQRALRANGLSGNVQVVNVPGASGTVGLQTVAELNGADDTILVVGSAMVGGVEITQSTTTLDDVTPITSATTDYPVIVLPANSPYADAEAFVEAWKADPAGHPIGGGALGNADHLAVIALAQAVGISPSDVNYIAYSGGGEVLASILSNTVAAGVSGYGEISDQIAGGTVRGIGITSNEPVEGIDMPTFAEQGIDVVMPNWRGFVAPPGLSDDQREEIAAILAEMFTTPEWADAVDRNEWEEFIITEPELDLFIDEQIASTATLLKEAGV